MTILVTGGAGYIGSHTCVELLNAGQQVTVFDNFSNSQPEALARVEGITGKKLQLMEGDIRDRGALRQLFDQHRVNAVIHFAGLKAVGESVEKPLLYYDNNIGGSIVLFEAMAEAKVKSIVFSSSATVYGDPARVPITEDFPLSATNPYGRSKLFIEEMLRDIAKSDPEWSVSLLRYFNPVGAHESGQIGEDPRGIPNNLMPYIAQVAVGMRPYLNIFGGDYPTPDGTGIRDYIHVVDLARGHVAALVHLQRGLTGVNTWNLGTGQGMSVLDMVRAFEIASGKSIPYKIVARREGDVAQCWADASKAEDDLEWHARLKLDRMCADTWRWQQINPKGYVEKQ